MNAQSTRAMKFLADIEEGRTPITPGAVPAADRDIMALAAVYLDEGYISARRLTKALQSDFAAMDASFLFHKIDYHLFQ